MGHTDPPQSIVIPHRASRGAWLRTAWRVRQPVANFDVATSIADLGQWPNSVTSSHSKAVPAGQLFPMTDTSPPRSHGEKGVSVAFAVIVKHLIETLPLLLKKERRRKPGRPTFIHSVPPPCPPRCEPGSLPRSPLTTILGGGDSAGALCCLSCISQVRAPRLRSVQWPVQSHVACKWQKKGFKFIPPGSKTSGLFTEPCMSFNKKRKKINYYPINKFGKQKKKIYDTGSLSDCKKKKKKKML